jgi:hypothetical protein
MPSPVEVDISSTFKFQCMYEFRVLSLLNFLCRNFKVQVLIETHFKLWIKWMMKEDLNFQVRMYSVLGLKKEDETEEKREKGDVVSVLRVVRRGVRMC